MLTISVKSKFHCAFHSLQIFYFAKNKANSIYVQYKKKFENRKHSKYCIVSRVVFITFSTFCICSFVNKAINYFIHCRIWIHSYFFWIQVQGSGSTDLSFGSRFRNLDPQLFSLDLGPGIWIQRSFFWIHSYPEQGIRILSYFFWIQIQGSRSIVISFGSRSRDPDPYLFLSDPDPWIRIHCYFFWIQIQGIWIHCYFFQIQIHGIRIHSYLFWIQVIGYKEGARIFFTREHSASPILPVFSSLDSDNTLPGILYNLFCASM